MKNPIVYLHGLGGSTEDWAEIKKILPGESPALHAASLEECVANLAARLPPTPHLCGYSMGGRIAILLATELEKRGRPPRSVALLASGIGFPNEKERNERREADQKWAALARENAESFWEKWYSQPLFSSFQALAEGTKAEWLKRRKSMNIEHLVRSLESFGPGCHEDLRPLVGKLLQNGISVLYIAGDMDKKYLNLGKSLQAEEGLELRIIGGAGHLLPLEAPAETARHLAGFFAETEK